MFEKGRRQLESVCTNFQRRFQDQYKEVDFDAVIKKGFEVFSTEGGNFSSTQEFISNHMEHVVNLGFEAIQREKPSFAEDPKFGLMAKYVVAWENTVQAMLMEGAFFSIAHLLESMEEINCSILLASEFYYKQSLQVLRGFIEHIVVQLYFCDNPKAFTDWKSNQFHMPALRGKNGMLQSLVNKNIVDPTLASVGANLYGQLNGAIHSSEDQLIHRGALANKGSSLSFQEDRFQEWCDFCARAIDFGIRVTQINIRQWEIADENGNRCCPICHQAKFSAKVYEDESGVYTKITCSNCGSKSTMNGDTISPLTKEKSE